MVLRRSIGWRFVDASGTATEIRPTIRFAVNDPRAAVDVAHQPRRVRVTIEALLGG